jgi:uncharacterized protein (TIGR03067 family)
MKLRVLAIVAAGLLIAAGKEGKKVAKDSLIGTWKIESLEQGGKKLDLAQAQEAPSKIMFDDKKIIATVKDEEHTVSYTIDATKKPKEIDMTPQDGPNKDRTMKGIYELKGDTLRICLNPEDTTAERPKKLATEEGSRVVIATFKRVKK